MLIPSSNFNVFVSLRIGGMVVRKLGRRHGHKVHMPDQCHSFQSWLCKQGKFCPLAAVETEIVLKVFSMLYVKR